MDSSPTKIDVYKIVTDQIISLLEQGIVPWQKPWAEGVPPMNLLSKRQYRGINLWLLASLNYERNLFLTWDQLKSIGGSVLKDEKGHVVVFWKPAQKKKEEEAEGKKPAPMLRYYKVFNVAQCKDIPEHLIPNIAERLDFNPLDECEAIVKEMPDPPTIQHKQQQAYYAPLTDILNMPKKKSFATVESYYATLFHELVHSTGAEQRLGRKTLTDMVPFGTPSYAMEELIAEMGSAFLCRFAGILPWEINSAVAYIDNWLGVFKKDKRFLITAAGQAQKAADLIMNKQDSNTKDEVNDGVGEPMIA